MISARLVGIAVRGALVVFGVWFFSSFFYGRSFSIWMGQFLGFDETTIFFGYFSLIDFAIMLTVGIVISHAIFWSCISRERRLWPRWGEPALKSLDYLWYSGAAVALVFVAAQAQSEIVTAARKLFEIELDDRQKAFRSSLEKISKSCSTTFAPPSDEASDDYIIAYTIVIAVCSELSESGTDARELWVADQAVLSRCNEANVDFWPPASGQSFSKDLWDHRPLLDAYSAIIGVCLNDHHIKRANEGLEAVRPYEAGAAFTGTNPLLSGYVSWFALLLAFRLSRTTAEVVEAVRNARKV